MYIHMCVCEYVNTYIHTAVSTQLRFDAENLQEKEGGTDRPFFWQLAAASFASIVEEIPSSQMPVGGNAVPQPQDLNALP